MGDTLQANFSTEGVKKKKSTQSDFTSGTRLREHSFIVENNQFLNNIFGPTHFEELPRLHSLHRGRYHPAQHRNFDQIVRKSYRRQPCLLLSARTEDL